MKNKILSLFLAFFFVISLSGIAMADLHNVVDMTETEFRAIMAGSESDMRAFSNPDGTFKEVRYFVKSTGATSGIRYRTKNFTFQVGQYGPAAFYAGELIKTPPKPGQTQYSKVTMSRDFFRALIGSTFPNGPALVGQALDTESYLKVGAVLEIYNASTGQVLATINSPDECQSKAIGFGPKDIADMKTRWQNVPLREGPDFYPTPEGVIYKEEYKSCAKAYQGKPGETITFPVTLNNSGTKSTTDFRAVWEGHGNDPVTGWQGTNPYWETVVELNKGESKTFSITATIPDKATKLFFKANTDGLTPAGEKNQDNNLMAIVIQPEGVDIEIIGQAIPAWLEVELAQNKTLEKRCKVLYTIRRLDGGLQPVDVILTMHGPGGTKTETLTIPPQHGRFNEYYTSIPGTYTLSAEVWPVGVQDINPSNNQVSFKFKFWRPAPPQRQDSDSDIRGGLGG